MYALEIKDLVKVYKNTSGGEKIALNSINLKVPKGSFFGLLGPNGAGKSTTIDILAGLAIKTSGKVKICGYDLDSNFIESRYKIGVVPQELLLDSFFTVSEILEYYAGYYCISDGKKKVKELIERLNLGDKKNTLTYALSGGMKRRLLVAKALIHEPDLVILDEPTAGVDIELRKNLWEYIKEINLKNGTTIIITTHYLEEAEQLCDEVAMLNRGNIVVHDTITNLISKYTTKKFFIKLGSMQSVPDSMKKYELIQTDEGILITIDSKEPNSKIIQEIFSGFQDVIDFKVINPSLEDVFQKLMR